jgi:hypothetical protein
LWKQLPCKYTSPELDLYPDLDPSGGEDSGLAKRPVSRIPNTDRDTHRNTHSDMDRDTDMSMDMYMDMYTVFY